jgi:hypothetical protein
MSLDITNSYTNISNSELISMTMHKLKENEYKKTGFSIK